MAKLKGPLLSLSASGAIAKTIVYFNWKGLKVARQWVMPTNPNTDAQKTQRGYLRAAVAMIHTVMAQAAHPLTAVDKAAYASLASIESGPRTWFNEISKVWLKTLDPEDGPVIYTGFEITDLHSDAFACIAYLNEAKPTSLLAGTFYFGTSKTALIHSAAATPVSGVSVALVAEDISDWAVEGEKYYMQFRPDEEDPCEGAVSGIFSFVCAGETPT
jgi:hypothetical protein